MWMVFAIVSMVLCAAGEMVSNKIIRKNVNVGPFLVYFATSLFGFISAIFIWLAGKGESGASPVHILKEHPLILLSTTSTFLSALLVLVAFRYIGVSIEATVSGISAIFLFLGLVSIHVFTGKLEAMKEILFPGRLISVLVIIVLIFFLAKSDEDDVNAALKKKKKRTAMVTGILILLVSSIFDASDSLIVAYCVGDNQVGAVDYYIAMCFADMLFGTGCLVTALVKLKKTHSIKKEDVKSIPGMILVGFLSVACMLTYMLGSDYDAVNFAMSYIAYPIVPLAGARFFLKERYTVKQYIGIVGIVIASIAFCVMDYI